LFLYLEPIIHKFYDIFFKFPRTFSGKLTFCSGKKNIFEGEIMLEFKRFGALKRNPEIGKIPGQTFQVLE